MDEYNRIENSLKLPAVEARLRAELKKFKVLSKKRPSPKLDQVALEIEGLAYWAASLYVKEGNITKQEAMLRLIQKAMIRRRKYNPPVESAVKGGRERINANRSLRLAGKSAQVRRK